MKKRVRKLAVILMAFAVTFTSLPIMTGDFSVHAATAKKPVKVTGVKRKAAGTNYITVKWNRIKGNKNTKGYTIYLNGKSVKSVVYNTLYYKVTGLKQNTNYTFQVRAYNTYKQKQYYNAKTRKWQAKKPKKKFWKKCPSGKYAGKKTITVTKYKFGPASAAATIRTAKVATVTSTSVPASGNSGSSSTSTGTTKTVTDFRGTTRVITKHQDSAGIYWTYKTNNGGDALFDNVDLPRYDKTQNGTFTYDGSQYKQQSGATFRLTGGGVGYTYGSISSPKDSGTGAFYFEAYNVDASKVQMKLVDASYENVNTFSWDIDQQKVVPFTETYIKKNGKRIATSYAGANGKHFDYVPSSKQFKCYFSTTSGPTIGTGLGIYNGTFIVQILYDGIAIGNMSINTCLDSLAANGMSPKRRMYYAVAETAIAASGGSAGSILGDKRKISDWIKANISHGQTYTTSYGTISSFGCQASTAILETWLIYKYGEPAYGFARGSVTQPRDHIDYCLNSDPNSPFLVTYKN